MSGNGEDEDEEPERDPFGQLDESIEARDGDPFESLAGDGDESPDSGSGPQEAGGANTTEEAAPGFQEVSEPSVGPSEEQAPDEDPFSEATPDFAEVDLGDVDEDSIWEAISDAQARGSVAEVHDRTYAEVSKHSYCEGCEYFTGPPESNCNHDGTEILEFVDMETVRVVDCPIVAERRQLER
jgi:hypothetical protein